MSDHRLNIHAFKWRRFGYRLDPVGARLLSGRVAAAYVADGKVVLQHGRRRIHTAILDATYDEMDSQDLDFLAWVGQLATSRGQRARFVANHPS